MITSFSHIFISYLSVNKTLLFFKKYLRESRIVLTMCKAIHYSVKTLLPFEVSPFRSLLQIRLYPLHLISHSYPQDISVYCPFYERPTRICFLSVTIRSTHLTTKSKQAYFCPSNFYSKACYRSNIFIDGMSANEF